MISLDPITHFRLFVREDFFDERTCAELVAAVRRSDSSQSTLYGRSASSSVDDKMRRSLRHELQSEFINQVKQRLLDCMRDIEAHFSVKLHQCEEPQFLSYREGDFFVAHQDGNTGLLRLDQENRRVSVVIFLSPSDAHRGGELVFHDYRRNSRLPFSTYKPGTLVAFPSETTHEVTPVISGERFSIACWYR